MVGLFNCQGYRNFLFVFIVGSSFDLQISFFCNLLKKKISYVPSLYSHKWPSNWPELIAGYELYFKLAKTHMLGHVQYRAVSLGLMGSLPNNCLGVLSGMTT
jgi:hypothetical protein